MRPLMFLLLFAAVAGCDRSGSINAGGVRISEVLPDARRFTAPGWAGAWDAIELYNPSPRELKLGGYYLSDSGGNLRKWAFPQGTVISGKGFLVVAAGGEPTEALHATFGLSSEESVYLTAPDGVTVIDRVDLPALGTDVAWVADPDDPRRHVATWRPTPGRPNQVIGLYLRVVNVMPAYPYSPVTITVRADRKLPGAQVMLRYKVNPGGAADADTWPGIAMTPDARDPKLYTAVLSGRGLAHIDPGSGARTVIGWYVHTVNEWGRTVYDPDDYAAGAGARRVHRIRVGCEKRLMLSEVMPQSDFVRVDTGNLASSPGWVELYNYGEDAVSLDGVYVNDVYLGETGRAKLATGFSVPPGSSQLLYARALGDVTAFELPYRLSKGGGMLVLRESLGSTENLIEISRLSFDTLQTDEAAGRCGNNTAEEARALRFTTPRFPNSCGADRVWFTPDVAVWVEWSGMAAADTLNPAAGEPVTVWARLGWEDMWSPAAGVPVAAVAWEDDGGRRGAAEMRRVGGEAAVASDCFTAAIGSFARGARVSYTVTATLGRTTIVAPRRVFAAGYERPPVTITEVGLRGEYESVAAGGGATAERMRTFVELHNAGDAPFDLAGRFLSLFARALPGTEEPHASRYSSEEWRLEEGVIPPGGYAVIDLDGGTTGRPSLLARYRGGAATLYDRRENGNAAIDRFRFKSMADWEALGAFGRSACQEEGAPQPPSPGEPNLSAEPRIVVNEIGLWGPAEPYVELFYHAEDCAPPVALDGFEFGQANDPTGASRRRIVAGDLELGPGQQVAVRLGPLVSGAATCDIAYSPTGGQVYLWKPDDWPWGGLNVPLDSLQYASVPARLAYGRKPDGGVVLSGMMPTPDAPNCGEGVRFVRDVPHRPRDPAAGEAIAFTVMAADPCSAMPSNPGGSVQSAVVRLRWQGSTTTVTVALTRSSDSGAYQVWTGGVSGAAAGRVGRYLVEGTNAWDQKTWLSRKGEQNAPVWDDAFVFTVGCAPSDIVINEIAPGAGGFIELLNTGGLERDIGGLEAEVRAGGAIAAVEFVPAGTVVPPGGLLVLDYAGLPPAGALRLSQPPAAGGCVVDATAWAALPEGRSWGRVPDGDGAFGVCVPTPARPNQAAATDFIRGDCNEDGVLDPRPAEENADLAALLAHLEGMGPPLRCEDRCDINDDGVINYSDVIYFLRNYFHTDTPWLPPPFPEPGLDPTPDALRCD
ncbi:MAG TPA: lamin tail domain-containing protein [Planctomycetota bacterium]|mgnify:CR=1 FL=1|nr:lamin tail domain-containing protein [Planctomycetota bacterium]OQC22019.1 MAG: hypothetical protein BWX69_00329 [Planctomycetes bacterium ADurb.Bin069]HNR98098.1 lamin tail domain-containing protein [Planctomycetota bacterium]HNU25539.1 lamin tail domain-containing protein [Planctomycetota bacterium]HOE28599.1 lamin tail domain-containing protein [Planctomycetota bacterium]